MPITALVIAAVLLVGTGISLFLWSCWADREAAYEPELLTEEASLHQLGIHLGFDGNIQSGNG